MITTTTPTTPGRVGRDPCDPATRVTKSLLGYGIVSGPLYIAISLTQAVTRDVPPGNRLEKLRGDRAGQYSVRVNQQWRICFQWTSAGPEDVEIVDYH